MTRQRRLSILALAALLCVGAGAGGLALLAAAPGPAAVGDGSPSPRPRATPFPTATPRYTMPPANSRCPTLNALYQPPRADLAFLSARGFGHPPTVEVARSPLQLPFRPAPPDEPGVDEGVLLGGRTQRMEVATYYETAGNLAETARLTSIELTLQLPDDAQRRLQIRVTGDNRTMREFDLGGVPDTDAMGQLHVRITWEDQCYQYVAAGTMTARVVSVASTSACGVGENAAWRQLEELLDPPLAFGNGAADLLVTDVWSLLVDMPIIDGPYPVIAYDPAARSATARPGEAISFHSTNPDLVLAIREDHPTVEFYARDAVIGHIQAGGVFGGGQDVPPVVAQSSVEQLDGRFVVKAPEAPGRYVAGISLNFTSACLTGGVVAGAGLDVAGS